MTETWSTALSVLGGGVGFGLISAFALSRSDTVRGKKIANRPANVKHPRAKKAPAANREQGALIALRDEALAQIRELDTTALTDVERDAQRTRLELIAAKAWRDLERHNKSAAAAAPAVETEQQKPQRFLAGPWVWGVGIGVSAVVAVIAVNYFAKPRAVGDSMTGGDTLAALKTESQNSAAQQGGMPGQANPHDDRAAVPPAALASRIHELEQVIAKTPDVIEPRLELADLYLQSENGLFQAFQQAKVVLDKHPDNAEALMISAVVRSSMGENEAAFDLADRSVKKDPNLANGWVARGKAALGLGKRDIALASLQKAADLEPGWANELNAMLKEAGAPAGATAAAAAPAMAAAPSQAAAAPAGGPGIQGTIDIDRALAANIPDTAVVFVMAKDGTGNPMPVAAKRFPATAFPIRFTLGPEDAVMGRPMPANVTLEARLDSDGSASTRGPTDPTARLDNVAMGTTGLNLVLRAPQ